MIPVGIRVLDNVIPNVDEVFNFVYKLNNWSESVIIGENGNPESSFIRTSKTFHMPMLSWNNNVLLHEMNKAVWQALDEYATDFSFSFSGIEDVSIQKYEIKDYYKPHNDADTNVPRIVSAVAYLNTVDLGGETRFCNFNYSVSPVAGRLAIFPSNYVFRHEALPPKSGIKIAAAYWAR